MTTKQEQYARLRKLFNSAIQGKNTDAVLWALANPAVHLVNTVEAVHDNVYISTAVERYLDQRLADYNLVRPPEVGLADDIFRLIGINVVNRKQVRELLMSILAVIFGDELTQATAKSTQFEPYNLDDGDRLKISFDGGAIVEVEFTASQFANISAATAQEVADAITKSLRSQGKTGRAFAKDDGSGGYVTIISDTEGPQSSVVVWGGRAQNELLFDRIRPTTGGASTQWTVEPVSGGSVRFTWTGGANPSIGKVKLGDYVNIFGSGFDTNNQGTFLITDVKGGIVGSAYFEVENPTGVAEVVAQGTVDGILFFQPFKNSLTTKNRYAAIFQEEPRLLEVFIPATTKVVRRDRKGAAHLHEPVLESQAYSLGQNQVVDFTFPDPASINDGDYFLINSANNDSLYYVYLSQITSGSSTVTVSDTNALSTGNIASVSIPDTYGSGQTFKAVSTDSLMKIALPIYKEGSISGTTSLRVYQNPSFGPFNPGVLLGTSDPVDVSTLAAVPTDTDFVFSSPIPLNTTDTYLFLLDPLSISGLSATDRIRISTDTSNSYADGSVVVAAWSGSDPSFGFLSPGSDLNFKVYTQAIPLDPAIPSRTGIQVDISAATTATEVANAVVNTLNTYPYFSSVVPNSPTARVCWLQVGDTDIPVNGNISGLTIAQFQAGQDPFDTTTTSINPDESLPDQEGPYTYDVTQPFVLSDVGTALTSFLGPDSSKVIQLSDSSEFPDEQGFVAIAYGTDRQEAPIPYLARPSSNTLLLNPSAQIINDHAIGTEVRLISQTGPISVSKDGADFPFYLTDVVAGRIYAEELIKEVAATGINLVITILYPGDEGLAKWATADSEKVEIWGEDSDV